MSVQGQDVHGREGGGSGRKVEGRMVAEGGGWGREAGGREFKTTVTNVPQSTNRSIPRTRLVLWLCELVRL